MDIAATAKKAAEVVGIVTALAGGYVTLGGPIPATVHYVDSSIKPLKAVILEGQRKTIRVDRNFLVNEREALTRALGHENLDSSSRSVIIRRKSEIEAQIQELQEEDEQIRRRIHEAK